MNARITVPALLCSLLAACGGGSNSSDASVTAASVQTGVGSSTGSSTSGSSSSSSSGSGSSSSSSSSSSGSPPISSSGSSSSSGASVGAGPAAQLAAKLGKPSRLLFGLGGQTSGDTVTLAVSEDIKPDIVDAYLVGAGSGDWTSWNSPAGYYVQVVAQKAESVGAIPMYTLYQMAQNGGTNLSGLSSQSFMNTYWANVKLLFQQIAVSGKPALVNVEPDFWGVTEEQSNGQPSTMFAYVNSNSDCSNQPNTVAGIAGCVIEMARKYAPKAYVGFPPSWWGGQTTADVVAYMNAVGAEHADFIVAQTSDRDAGCYELQASYCSGGSGPWYWDETNQTHPNFQDHLTQIQAYHTGIGNLPVVWWQTPEGAPSSSQGGSPRHYRDNRVHYFLTHPSELTAVGGLGVVFGDGAQDQTDITTDEGEFQQLSNQYLVAPAALP